MPTGITWSSISSATSRAMARIAAVVFDMDGLMVDTEPVYQAAWQQAAREVGHSIDDEFYEQFVGRPTEACEAILLREFGSGFPLAAFRARWPVLWRQAVERGGIAVKPGLVEMLDFVEQQRL